MHRLELHGIPSRTATDGLLLGGDLESADPVTLGAALRIPEQVSAPMPAVVLLHGSSGLATTVARWEPQLLAMGMATLAVDSFSARGVRTTNDDQGQLAQLTMVLDAYRALALLCADARIDAGRIALMGFSLGGQGAVLAGQRRLQQRFADPPSAGFAAFVALYPVCALQLRQEQERSTAPLLILHGDADDYVAPAQVQRAVARWQAAGCAVELELLPGAGHLFDAPRFDPPLALPRAQTLGRCVLEEAADGGIINAGTGLPFHWQDPCVGRGATLAYNAEAAQRALDRVGAFLTAHLEPACVGPEAGIGHGSLGPSRIPASSSP